MERFIISNQIGQKKPVYGRELYTELYLEEDDKKQVKSI